MSTFPTSKDAFVNPTPTTPKNDPAVPLSSAISRLNSAVVAIQDTVGITASVDPASIQYRLADAQAVAAAADQAISAHVVAGDPHSQYTTQTEVLSLAPAETGSTIGALVVAGADVTSPQDVDLIPLAVSSVLRKFSWANLKAALAQLFPLLAGASGGQTINGGTTAAQNLTLRSTAHATKGAIIFGAASEYDEANNRLGIGTLTPSAKVHSLATTEQLRLGYDASNYYAITASSAGAVTHDATGQQHTFKGGSGVATLSGNLVTNGDFASSLSGWTDSGSSWSWSAGTALHTAGEASTLSQQFATTSGAVYAVRFTMSGRTTGTVTVSIGADTLYNYASTTVFTANATVKRGIIASASSSAGIVITPSSDFNGSIDDVQVFTVTSGSATPTLRLAESGGTSTVELRPSAISQYNCSLGQNALRSAVGTLSSVAVGYDTGRSMVDGSNVVVIGTSAAQNAINPQYATIVGASAAQSIVNPYNLVAIGYNAGRYLADGSSTNTQSANCVYIGNTAKASADAVTNENVFGYNATGIGSNSCVLGSSAVTKCQIFGDIILDKTVTAGGTTGAQTINKTVGSVNFAAGATSLVVTNNRVTASSIIIATVATADATMKSVVAVAASGSFTLTANAAATSETRVNWIVIN